MTKAQQTANQYGENFIAEFSNSFITDDKGVYNVFHTNTGICQGRFNSLVNAYNYAEVV